MSSYHHLRQPGAVWFFTVNLLERNGNLLMREIDRLRGVVRGMASRHPFTVHAWAVLPDHLHCVIALPAGDADYANRWRLIKQGFSRDLPKVERRSAVRLRRGERGIWQRRFWEHPDPGRCGLPGAHGLRAHQSRKAWPGAAGR